MGREFTKFMLLATPWGKQGKDRRGPIYALTMVDPYLINHLVPKTVKRM